MTKASMESQIGTAPVEVSDTEEMFWLRQNDDLQSKVTLGNLLSTQYRFREALDVWNRAALDYPDDISLYLRIGAAYLTVFDLEKSMAAYDRYLKKGGSEKDISYPLGIWHYLNGEYEKAASYFEKIMPCGDEMLISVIYWHLLSDLKAGRDLGFLKHYHDGINAGHHKAYETVVRVLAGEKDLQEALAGLTDDMNDLDGCILGYGLYCILRSRNEECRELSESILSRTGVWPSVAYLAAWNDIRRNV